MSELSTVLIQDSRYNDITDRVTIGVKDGPASVIYQKYQPNSNSSSSTLFNVNVPSENTLVDRNIHIQGNVSCYYTTTIVDGASRTFKVVPAAFPLNQALQSASLTLNNSKLSVQTQDILPVYLKQFHQKFLSKNCQMTPSYVDKYYGKVADANTNSGSGSYMSGIESAEKDSDTVGRLNENFTVTVYRGTQAGTGGTVVNPTATGEYTVANATGANVVVTVVCSVSVSEPILGLPTATLIENESNYLGINNLELLLQWNDMRNVFNISSTNTIWSSSAGDFASNLVISDAAKLNLKYMSLHASQYAKLHAKNVLGYDEIVSYKKLLTVASAGTETTDVISMRQIPNYIYMVVKPSYNSQKPQFSNHLCFPISGMNITFNNVSGLLTSYTQEDLYQMSRRNGSQQTLAEFRGVIKNRRGAQYAGIGSIIVIDPVRDLGLSDFLSSGSLGQFSFQATVTFDNITGHTFGPGITPATAENFEAIEIATICNYGGILINQSGSSSTMSGLLTKQSVLEAKAGNNPTINYEEINEMTGGNFGKMGLTTMSGLLDKAKNMGKSKAKELIDKLSKYT